MLFYSKKDH